MSTPDEIYFPKWVLDAMLKSEASDSVLNEWPYFRNPKQNTAPCKPSPESTTVSLLYAYANDFRENELRECAGSN